MTDPPHTGDDRARRDPEALARAFRWFGEVECPQIGGHLYQTLCRGIAGDASLLALAGRASATQPPPNLLFAAVHFLLLGGAEHELREWYPGLTGGQAHPPESGFPPFRDFCAAHREAIAGLVETRLTQTNVIQRCSALLPAFSHVYRARGEKPLALIEIGSSAGLNLHWDRFRYVYDEGSIQWGDPESPVRVPCELRGAAQLTALAQEIPVAWRRGVDLHPIDVSDVEEVRWLRALIWPEHIDRHARLESAIAIARSDAPEILRGSAADRLPELLAAAPAEATLCVYGTHTLYQFPPDALRATLKCMQAASRERSIDFISIEGTGDRCSELKHVAYRGDGGSADREVALLANANPHGRWLEWLA